MPSQKKSLPSTDAVLPSMPLLTAITVLSNTVIKEAGPSTSVEGQGDLQLPYRGHLAASTSDIPEMHISSQDLNISTQELANMDLTAEIDNLFGKIGSDGEAALTLTKVNTESKVNAATSTSSQVFSGISEVGGSIQSKSVVVCDLATPQDGYDSADEFQPKKFKGASDSSSKGKGKAKASQIGIGNYGKGSLLKLQNETKKEKKVDQGTKDTGVSILKSLLTETAVLPARKRPSGPKKSLGGAKKVKPVSVKSVVPVGNIAAGSGRVDAVLPDPVARAPVVRHTTPDVQPEVFSQRSSNVINDFRLLCERIRRKHADDLAAFQRAEQDFQRAEEALRQAQEARRVAFDTLEERRSSLNKSAKMLRELDRV